MIFDGYILALTISGFLKAIAEQVGHATVTGTGGLGIDESDHWQSGLFRVSGEGICRYQRDKRDELTAPHLAALKVRR
jgi:hypothetical protein